MKQFIFRRVFVLALIACTVPASRAASRSQREHGAELFNANGCLHCHVMGKVGGHKGPDLSGVGRSVKPIAIRNQIIDGGNGMPAFGDVFEAKELDDLIEYLRSCRVKPQK
jgi:mono/diheme cytochrome c family protein